MKDTIQFLDISNMMEEAMRHATDEIGRGADR